jgi:hypothetical protein
MVRVFPALLLAGLVAQAIRDAARRRDTRWAARLAAGFLLAAALLLAAGAATGRGAAAWPEFAANLRKHQATWLTNNVGLKNTLLYGPDTLARRLVDWRLPEPWTAWQERMAALEDERRWLILAAGGALTLLALRSALREGPDGAAAASLALAFAFATPTCYYWGALVLTLARRPRATAGALLVLNLALCAAHLATPVFEARYGLMSWGLLLFFVWWLPEEGLYRRILSRGSRPPLAAGGLLC